MADNTQLNLGSGGDILATDDLGGGVKVQRVKITHGYDGESFDVNHNDPLPVSTYFEATSPSIDMRSRLRVSNPDTIFDIKHLHDKQPLFFDESITNNSTTATSTHSTTNAAVTMTVGANDTIVRQSKMRFNYQPGKSQQCFYTGLLGTPTANVKRRIGSFDASNGVFFELNGSTMQVVVRKAGSDTQVAQPAWNLDPLDGTGTSGETLDVSKTQLFVVNYDWLGVGRVRFGFVFGGNIVYCHQFTHANSSTSVYMSTPNLPIRYEISSTGGTGSLMQICSTVLSEGGLEPKGVIRTTSTAGTHVDAQVADTIYAVLGIRLKSTYADVVINPIDFSMLAETSDAFRYILSINPTISGTFSYSDLSDSAVQVAKGTILNTVSSLGISVAEGFASAQTRVVSSTIENALKIGSTISGTADTLVLSVMPLSNGADIQASLSWRELH